MIFYFFLIARSIVSMNIFVERDNRNFKRVFLKFILFELVGMFHVLVDLKFRGNLHRMIP